MHLGRTVAELTSQCNDLGDDQLRNTAGVAEGRVEDGDTVVCGILQVDLIRPNTEAADDDEIAGLFQDARGELGLGTDANHVDITVEQLGQLLKFKAQTERKYRIFSISWSSGSEDLRNSTW